MKRVFMPVFLWMVIFLFSGNGIKAQISEQSTLGPKYGKDSATCVMEISLYREFYKQWKASNYNSNAVNDAIKSWRWVFFNCPLGTENTYIDGAKIFEYRIQNEKDTAKRNRDIDTLMMIYDQRIKYFPMHYREKTPQEGDILGRKGIDLYQYKPSAYEKAYDILKRSVELNGNLSDAAVVVYYFLLTTQMANENKIPKDTVLDTYDRLMDIVDYNLKTQTDPGIINEFKTAKNSLDQMFEPFASCDDIIAIFTKTFNQKGNDPEILKKIIALLYRKNCTDSQLYFDATVKLYDLEPTPESAFIIGRMYLKKQDYQSAIKYLLDATQTSDTALRADSYLLLADSYRLTSDYPKARSFAYKSLELRPKDGNAYILIGDLYALSSKDCGTDDYTQKTVYWAAVDKYIKAKSVDPSVAATADDRIETYSKAFPSLQDNFFHDLKNGDTYEIDCWINETTTVRSAK
jgi:tetratricopeptide (TPR) repeat protein